MLLMRPAEPRSHTRRVLFVDWHGVLCTAPFWHSILLNPHHPYHARLKPRTNDLFVRNAVLVRDWMRGRYTAAHIVNRMAIPHPRNAKPDYFLRTLYRDCATMPLHQHLTRALRHLATTGWWVVIATDNMDCFATTARTRPDIRTLADGLICSSEIGLLKADNPAQFFGHWLTTHHTTITHAVLLDDSPTNCVAFTHAGGTAYHVPDHNTAARAVWHLATISATPERTTAPCHRRATR